MATTVRYHHGLYFCSDLESGRVMCDAFADQGGAEYPSAPELLMVSLGACVGAVLITYASRHDLNYEGLEVELDWDIAEHPHRIGRIDIKVRLPGPLPPPQVETLKRVAEQCLIHNTLLHSPQINLDLRLFDPQAEQHEHPHPEEQR